MSVPTTPTYQLRPNVTNNLTRTGTSTTTPTPKPPPLPDLIQQQPLPNPTTPQYEQTLALYQKALSDLQANQASMLAMQQQYNRMAATNPTANLMKMQMAMYQGDPYAAERAAMNAMYRTPQRTSMSYYNMGY